MSTFRFAVLSLPIALGTLVLSCQSDGSGPDGVGGQGGQGGAGPSVARVTRTLGQHGGKIATDNVTLVFPGGALQKDTKITVSELDQDAIEALPGTSDGIKLAGIPAKFTPHGITFEQSVDVAMNYDPPEGKSEPLAVLKLDNDQDTTWEFVPGAKFDSGKASFQIDGFSCYGVFADPDGVAQTLYGADASGTGGTGSGGAGSGGDGSGGKGSGGASGGSASGGSGTGGVTVADFGYLDTQTFHGYGEAESGPGASIDSDLDMALTLPHCATGSTGATVEGTASLVYSVNEDPDHTDQGPILVPGTGIRVGVAIGDYYRSLIVELRGETETWCAPYYNESGALQFFPWQNFDTINCPGQQNSAAFDPAVSPIVKVAVTVPSNQEFEEQFDFCVDEISAGLPTGYLNGPVWFGYGWVDSDGVSTTVDDDLDENLVPNCISGVIDQDASAYAELGYYLDQPMDKSEPGPVQVEGTGLIVDILSTQALPVQVRLVSSSADAAYCAPLSGETGVYTIPWDDFVDCTSTAPFVPANAPLDSISVRVLSTGQTDAYSVCIEGLDEDFPID